MKLSLGSCTSLTNWAYEAVVGDVGELSKVKIGNAVEVWRRKGIKRHHISGKTFSGMFCRETLVAAKAPGNGIKGTFA